MREFHLTLLYLACAALVFSVPFIAYEVVMRDQAIALVSTAKATVAQPRAAAAEPQQSAPAALPAARPVWVAPTTQYNYKPPALARPKTDKREDTAARNDRASRSARSQQAQSDERRRNDAIRNAGPAAAQAYASGQSSPPPAPPSPVIGKD